jgi:hypothetical protein
LIAPLMIVSREIESYKVFCIIRAVGQQHEFRPKT